MADSAKRHKPGRHPNSLANLRPAPPAAKGNQLSKSHGARAQVPESRLAAKARAIEAEVADTAPVRAQGGGLPAHDAMLVRLLARALCRLEDVEVWIDEHGAIDRRGRPRSVLRWEARLRREVAGYLDALGMTPKARVKLGVDLARQADLAQAMSEPDLERRRRLMREAGVEEDDE